MKAGDFSQTFDSAGRQVVIYDPLTGDQATGAGRTPFANNVIPQSRLNPVALKMISYVPDAGRANVSNGSINFNRVGEINDRAYMYTGKMDHRFSDTVSLNGFYLYNKTNEPCANYFEPGLEGAEPLRRFPRLHPAPPGSPAHVEQHLAAGQQHGVDVPLRHEHSSRTTTRCRSISIRRTRASPSSFVSSLQQKKFPYVQMTDYGQGGTRR